MTTITTEAFRLRAVAEAGPIGKRHSSFELYGLLTKCMALAEKIVAESAFEEMRGLVAQQPRSTKRRYVEKGSDEYILVCRFVFGNLKSSGAERSNASRYAHCLRQAQQRGITSANLESHLREQGGVNALFLRRPLEATSVSTRCLYLTSSLSIPKSGSIRLELRRTADNRFDVIKSEVAE